MFAQVITGTIEDHDAFVAQAERWRDEVRPGAIGFLGSTEGETDDGTFVVLARFESAEAAARNNDRPEQAAWWEATQPFVSNVDFADSTDVSLRMGGGSDDAGFVQVMCGHIADPAAYDALAEREGEFEALMKEARPDVLGGVTVRTADDRYFDVVYFSSEEAARAGEATPMPAEVEAAMAESMGAAPVDRFLDLRAPRML